MQPKTSKYFIHPVQVYDGICWGVKYTPAVSPALRLVIYTRVKKPQKLCYKYFLRIISKLDVCSGVWWLLQCPLWGRIYCLMVRGGFFFNSIRGVVYHDICDAELPVHMQEVDSLTDMASSEIRKSENMDNSLLLFPQLLAAMTHAMKCIIIESLSYFNILIQVVEWLISLYRSLLM